MRRPTSLGGPVAARPWRAVGILLIGLLAWVIAHVASAETLSFRREPVTIITETGEFEFSAEIADSEDLRRHGLMFRYTLPADRAMLFDFGEPRIAGMWMKNTYIPLDIIFIRSNGEVASVAENTVPHSEEVVSTDEPVLAVLEVAAGTAARLAIKPGAKVRHPIFERGQ